ncbi:MAG: YWFCY domain-containing protein [Ginsengibacter sp.]
MAASGSGDRLQKWFIDSFPISAIQDYLAPPVKSKLMALLLLAILLLGSRGKKEEKFSRQLIVLYLIIGLLFYFISPLPVTKVLKIKIWDILDRHPYQE